MLILSRRKEERIRIGEDISVVVIAIRGDQVRLGIEAPKEVPVHRQEVFERIRADRKRHCPNQETIDDRQDQK